jgi:hypothetical protein
LAGATNRRGGGCRGATVRARKGGVANGGASS